MDILILQTVLQFVPPNVLDHTLVLWWKEKEPNNQL